MKIELLLHSTAERRQTDQRTKKKTLKLNNKITDKITRVINWSIYQVFAGFFWRSLVLDIGLDMARWAGGPVLERWTMTV